MDRVPYSREQFMGEMEVICTDFFGERKTRRAVREMWKDQLENLYNDGYDVDKNWKITKEELDRLMEI